MSKIRIEESFIISNHFILSLVVLRSGVPLNLFEPEKINAAINNFFDQVFDLWQGKEYVKLLLV